MARTEHPTLFSSTDETPTVYPPAVRRTDPSTSRTAARANPDSRATQRRRILEALDVLGTATDCQLSNSLGILRGSAAKRRGELVTDGLVERAGRGVTDTGSPAFTWRLTTAGRLWLACEGGRP